MTVEASVPEGGVVDLAVDTPVAAAAGADQEATVLRGWVHEVVESGERFVFRNAGGLVSVVCGRDRKRFRKHFASVRREDVVELTGFRRTGGDGADEFVCEQLVILNKCRDIPFTPETRSKVSANLRAKYRYLEFRDPEVLDVFRARHRFLHGMATYLTDRDFIAVETPLLIRPAGTGAREFGVASDSRPGMVYALPQSSQVYGQLTVMGGVESYYQITRCFRDEDLRANRQPEFTQLHVEMAFVETTEIMAVVEGALRAGFSGLGKSIDGSIPRLSFDEAARSFGTDKPDLRRHIPVQPLPHRVTDGRARQAVGLYVADPPRHLRLTAEDWTRLAGAGAERGFELVGHQTRPGQSLGAYLPMSVDRSQVSALLTAEPADAGTSAAVWIGPLRRHHVLERALYAALADHHFDPSLLFWAWVDAFPLFETSTDQRGTLVVANHPFVAPQDEEAFLRAKRNAELLRLRSNSFDLVLNGEEVGSGSLVNHRADVQERMLKVLGLRRRDVDREFGFLLRALDFGAPPVGGFGLGVDRVVAALCGKSKIRDVIAYPKTKTGVCPVTTP